MPIIEEEIRKERKATMKLEKQERAREEKAERQKAKRLMALIEEDKQACLAAAYPPGTICFFFTAVRDTWDKENTHYNNRLCRILEVLPIEKFKSYEWYRDGILELDALNTRKLKYRVVFVAQPPLFNEDGPEMIVEDQKIISLDEVIVQGGVLREDEDHGTRGRLLKPERAFERKAYYSDGSRVEQRRDDDSSVSSSGHGFTYGTSVGGSGAGSQI